MSNLFSSRLAFLDNLCALLHRNDNGKDDNALSISIDAGWGYGKTFFMNSLGDKLKEEGSIVVPFNAWESDISEDAFIAFADALITKLVDYVETETFKNEFLRLANSSIMTFGKMLFSSAVASNGILNAVFNFAKNTGDEFQKQKIREEGFFASGVKKTHLEEVKATLNKSLAYFFENCKSEFGDKRIFILVDELDRCRPDYSIQLLERVKHLFSNSKLCFVFAVNMKELRKSVVHEFGGIDSTIYFEKFFDYSFTLPEPSINDFLESFEKACIEPLNMCRALLSQMIRDAGTEINLREIEQMFRYFDTICDMDPEFKRFNGYSFYVPVAIFSRVVDGEFFKDCFGMNNSFRFESYFKKDYRFKNSVYKR